MLTFDEDELALRDLVRGLTKRFPREYWLDCARNKKYPQELWEAAAESGLMALNVPEEYGGADKGLRSIAIVMEELTRAGITLSPWQHTNWARMAILHHGTEKQKKEIIPATVNGTCRIALAATEADAGTNTFRVASFAQRTSDGYRLNGNKVFIGGADEAEYYLVIARTEKYDEAHKSRGLSLVLVPTNAPGISLESIELVMQDAVGRFVIHFDDVELTEDAVVGEPGKGARYMFSTLNAERVLVCAQLVGLGNHVLERGLGYAREREVFNGPIGQYQAVQHPFAWAKARLEAARLMMYHAADEYDAGVLDGHMANLGKLIASEAAFEAAEATVQAFGGYAFAADYDVWSLYTWIRLFKNAPINNPMVLNHISEHVLGLPRSY